MTPRQKIELRMSEVRQRLNEVSGLEGDDFTDEVRAEADTLGAEYRDLETRHRAAIIASPGEEGETEPTTTGGGDGRDRVELRQRASLGRFLLAALRGRSLDGAEAELAAEAGIDAGSIPLELWDVPTEVRSTEARADAATTAPSTTGVNLDPLRPLIYARAVAPRLGVAMPRVESGAFATATLTTGLTAGAMAAGAARESTAAAFTAQTTTPHRVSARMSIRLEDIATIGVGNFESILRQNVALALSDQLDQYTLNGDGQNANPTGLLARLTDPTDPTDVVTWSGFVSAAAGGIDGGPWAETMGSVTLLVNAETMRKAETTFQAGSGTDTPGELSAAAYLRSHAGGFFANRRMPDTASNIAAAVRYRSGTMGLDGVDAMRTAVCPVWAEVGIDDIYSDSASGTRHFTLHHLVGDVIIEQTSAYERVDFKLT